jgi:hypothetical protein
MSAHNLHLDPLGAKLRALPEVPAPRQLVPRVLTAIEAEQALHAKLRALPEVPAPASLAPVVLAALSRRASPPWWRQPWFAWPVSVRAATAVLALAVLALGGWFSAGAWQGVTAARGTAADWISQSWLVESGATVMRAMAALSRSVYALVLIGAGLLVATVYSATLVMGALCWRLAATRR